MRAAAILRLSVALVMLRTARAMNGCRLWLVYVATRLADV